MSTVPHNDEKLREEVRERYARTALQVLNEGEPATPGCCGTGTSCCGTSSSSCGTGNSDAVTADLYSSAELAEWPVAEALASLGWCNQTACAELKRVQRVPC